MCIPARVLMVLIMAVAAPGATGWPGRQDPTPPVPKKRQQGACYVDNGAFRSVAPHQSEGCPHETNGATVRARKRQSDRIVLSTRLVSVTVTVADSHRRALPGLTKESFEVFDDNLKQHVAFFSDEDIPISIGIVYDTSGSMKKRIELSLRALRRFIETSHEDDDFFLVGFADKPELLADFTTSANQIIGRLEHVVPDGSTALFDAVHLAIDKLETTRHARRAILVISDGEDNNSRYTAKALREQAQEADVLIYTIGIREQPSDPDMPEGWGRSVLEEIARMTGGRAFFPDARYEPELMDVCSKIALELRHQYVIGFYPPDRESLAKWHKIKIRVHPPRGAGRVSLSYRGTYRAFEN